MAYCPGCGWEVEEDDIFCAHCRRHLGSLEEDQYSRSGRLRPAQKLKKECPFCDGTGEIDGPFSRHTPITCPACHGKGYNKIPEDWEPCKGCNGTGIEKYGPDYAKVRRLHEECEGTGWVPVQY